MRKGNTGLAQRPLHWPPGVGLLLMPLFLLEALVPGTNLPTFQNCLPPARRKVRGIQREPSAWPPGAGLSHPASLNFLLLPGPLWPSMSGTPAQQLASGAGGFL